MALCPRVHQQLLIGGLGRQQSRSHEAGWRRGRLLFQQLT
jgi:hypothetical protein